MSDFAKSVIEIKKSNDKLLQSFVILKLVSAGLLKGYFFVGEAPEPDEFLKNLQQFACKNFPELFCYPVNILHENLVQVAYYFSLNTDFYFQSSVPLTQKEQSLYWYPSNITYCEHNSDESINTITYYIDASIGRTWNGKAEVEFDNILQFYTSYELPYDLTTFLQSNDQLDHIRNVFNLSVSYSVRFNYAFVEKKLSEMQPFSETELEKISDHFRQNGFTEVAIRVKQSKRKRDELTTKYDDLERCVKAVKLYNENRWNGEQYQIVKKLDNEINENW